MQILILNQVSLFTNYQNLSNNFHIIGMSCVTYLRQQPSDFISYQPFTQIKQDASSSYSSRQANSNSSLQFVYKNVHKKVGKMMFSYYQRMQLSMNTLLLALQLMQKDQFLTIVRKQLSIINSFSQTNQNSIFPSVNIILKQSANQKIIKSQIQQLIIEIFSISLLYITHKIVDDLKFKYTSKVWIQHLKLQKITTNDIKIAQTKICTAFNFDILTDNLFTKINHVIEQQLKIKNSRIVYFVHYLIEIYLNCHINKFIGSQNSQIRTIIMLSAIKLGCHFLEPRKWSDNILRSYGIIPNQVQKYSQKLFCLMIDKSRNTNIHCKYQLQRYKSVSKLKIVSDNSVKESQLQVYSVKQPQLQVSS